MKQEINPKIAVSIILILSAVAVFYLGILYEKSIALSTSPSETSVLNTVQSSATSSISGGSATSQNRCLDSEGEDISSNSDLIIEEIGKKSSCYIAVDLARDCA